MNFKAEDTVKINRPGRKTHGWVGRYLGTQGAIEGCAWVAFRAGKKQDTPPDGDNALRGSSDVQRLLIPLSQLEPTV